MTKNRMTTNQATRLLGEILEFGGTHSPASVMIWTADRYGRQWKWTEAAQCLRQAYQVLGAEHPETNHDPGYLWHCGSHPIQIAAVEVGRELDESLDSGPKPSNPVPQPGPVNPPGTYETRYSQFLAAVVAAELPEATIEAMDAGRNALAWRADRLQQVRGTQAEVKDLQSRYDRVVGRMLAMGWR